MYEKNCFITLTYNDKHLPYGNTLNKDHFVLFMKRLRKYYGPNIRFFQCGEYGETSTLRPHHHACLFNFDFEDKILFKGGTHPLYTSQMLTSLWGHGFASIGDVTIESASYVARYVLKKINGPEAKDHYYGREPEYITMSRGCKKLKTGGIGKKFFDKYHTDIYNHDVMILRGGIKTRPPKYYDNLYHTLNPEAAEILKQTRKDKIKKQNKKTLTQIQNKVLNTKLILKKLNKGRSL